MSLWLSFWFCSGQVNTRYVHDILQNSLSYMDSRYTLPIPLIPAAFFSLLSSTFSYAYGPTHTACTSYPLDLCNHTSVLAEEQWMKWDSERSKPASDLSLPPQMQTVNRGLTIKQYQPTIQPISLTPATTIQPIATVVTGSNVKDDYERAFSFQEKISAPPPPFATFAIIVSPIS